MNKLKLNSMILFNILKKIHRRYKFSLIYKITQFSTQKKEEESALVVYLCY